MKQIELLAPAGSLEKLEIALAYGADAVYMGGKMFGLRAFSDNFDLDELKTGIALAHSAGKKAYITINIFPHNDDLPYLPEYLAFLRDNRADAILISDLGVYRIAHEIAPDLPIHISTQANNTNWSSVLLWQELGAKRIVMARELSLREIKEIRERTTVELESFVHGAMCISYSGRCLLSNYFTGRDANRGECAQPCRWKYNLVEESRPGQYFPVVEDDRGSYIFNSKDLCLLAHLGELAEAGLNSLKIEGRMKSIHYVATVVKVYREALDTYLASPETFKLRDEWWEELGKISHRPYTTGFYFNKPSHLDQIYDRSTYNQSHDFIGLVKSYDPATGLALVEQRNNMKLGDEIEIMQPKGANFNQRINRMVDSDGVEIEVAPHPQQLITMPMARSVAPLAMLRRKGNKNA